MSDPVILALNCGSSSVRAAWFEATRDLRPLGRGIVASIGTPRAALRIAHPGGQLFRDEIAEVPDHATAIDLLLTHVETWEATGRVAAVGHRIVHGGESFAEPHLVDQDLLARLGDLVALAPLHLPANLDGIAEVTGRWPRIAQVACFDTAFHRTLPAVARLTSLPRELGRHGIRRYGFHGLSCESVLASLARHEGPQAAAGRLIVAHLGGGASMTAIAGGRSIDTTMGFSTAGGLVMGTRSGDLDPGLLLHLLRDGIVDLAGADALVYERGGLLGVSGISGDMQELLRLESSPAASEAIALYCHSARKHLGALVTVLGGVDRIVFTGGLGEHAVPIRALICAGLSWLGVTLDDARNSSNDRVVSADGSPVTVNVIPADEEAVIARHAYRVAMAAIGGSDAASAAYRLAPR